MNKVLVTDKVHPLLLEGLRQRGYEVEYNTSITLKDLPNKIGELTGIVINSKIIMDKEIMDAGKSLKFIARLGSGLEIIDLGYAKEKGIQVINSPEGNRDSVAEHAIGMLLMLANNLVRSNTQVKNMIWEREENRGFELMGKTLGIIGFGNTGSRLAQRLSTWGMNIVYHDISNEKLPQYQHSFCLVNLQDILNQSDIISLHLPLTPKTKKIVNDDFINACKDGVIIINTSRGKVVNTESLIKGLKSGKVGGACLDVFENEKPDTYRDEEYSMYKVLFGFENVIVSPHVAGWTNESLIKIAQFILKKLDGYS